jgi:hypothetical protein
VERSAKKRRWLDFKQKITQAERNSNPCSRRWIRLFQMPTDVRRDISRDQKKEAVACNRARDP